MNAARWIYEHVPVAGQNLMCSISGALRVRQRYDARFEERRRFFVEASRWDLERAKSYQLAQLQELFDYCHKNVPFYRDRLPNQKRCGAIGSLEEWPRIPSLSKNEVRQAGTALISNEFSPAQLVVSQSGGSTGMPLRCYHDGEALRQVYATMWAWQRPGVTRADKYAAFQGLPIIPPGQKAAPFWRMNYAMHQRLYSVFHLSEKTIGAYIDDLDRFEPVYLAGYANSLFLLSKLAEEQRWRPNHSPVAVFSTSEQLSSVCRETIERVFRTKVWDAYSQDETCGSITQYECGFYHYDRAYGYMEFEDMEALPQNRRVAEIVCTGFLNRAWPLLRYRPGDLVEYEPAKRCPRCGRAGPIIHAIRGRTGDVLVLPSGRRFPHISLVVKSLHGVRQLQLVQEARDRILIRFVPSNDFRGQADVELMRESFSRAVDELVDWQIQAVAEISRTRGGKFMSIVSQLEPVVSPRAAAEAAHTF